MDPYMWSSPSSCDPGCIHNQIQKPHQCIMPAESHIIDNSVDPNLAHQPNNNNLHCQYNHPSNNNSVGHGLKYIIFLFS